MKNFIIGLVLLAFITIPTVAIAEHDDDEETYCTSMYEMAKRLNKDQGIQPAFVGIINSELLITIFTKGDDPDGETWAIVSVEKGGKTCLRAGGSAFFPMGKNLKKEDTN